MELSECQGNLGMLTNKDDRGRVEAGREGDRVQTPALIYGCKTLASGGTGRSEVGTPDTDSRQFSRRN